MSHPQRSAMIATWLTRHPRTLAAALVLLVGISVALVSKLQVVSGQDVFFDPASPGRALQRQVEAQFVTDDALLVIYQAADVLAPAHLARMRALGIAFEEIALPGADGEDLFPIDKVTSLTTVKDLDGGEDGFRTLPLVPDPLPSEPAELARIRQRALNNPLVRDGLLADAGDAALIELRLLSPLDDERRAQTITRVRALLAQELSGGEGFQLQLAGEPVINADLASYQSADLGRFIPLSYLVMIGLLFAFVRSLRGVAAALGVVTVSLLAAMATLVLFGSSINNCSVMLPPVITALSVAMLLHYLSEHAKQAVPSGPEAARATLTGLLAPGLIAAVTTTIGFGSLGVSELPAVREFGLTAGLSMLTTLGVVTAFFVLLTVRPGSKPLVRSAGLACLPGVDGGLRWLARWVIRRRRAVLIGCGAVAVAMAAGSTRLIVDNNDLELFAEDTAVRQAAAVADAKLGGSTLVVTSIRAPRPGYFLEPEALRALEALARFQREELGVERVTSLVDHVKLMQREFAGGAPQEHRIPDSAEQVAQLMLLNGDTSIEELVDAERSWVRVVGRCDLHSSVDLDRLHRRLDTYLRGAFPAAAGFQAYGTGLSKLNADMLNGLIRSQGYGLALGCLLILGVLILLFGSWRIGLVSLLPNLLPVVCNLGLMGWIGLRLDAASVMISTVALGIAVDDTVHFLQHYRARAQAHGDLEAAVIETFRVKGPAIIWTSVVISAGFCVLLVSNFAPTRHFGLLIAGAMVTALLGDLLLLPALLLGLRIGRCREPAKTSASRNISSPPGLSRAFARR